MHHKSNMLLGTISKQFKFAAIAILNLAGKVISAMQIMERVSRVRGQRGMTSRHPGSAFV